MNESIRDIYANYRYDMLQIGLKLKDMSLGDAVDVSDVQDLLERSERLEALIDLYAYLLACQGGSRR